MGTEMGQILDLIHDFMRNVGTATSEAFHARKELAKVAFERVIGASAKISLGLVDKELDTQPEDLLLSVELDRTVFIGAPDEGAVEAGQADLHRLPLADDVADALAGFRFFVVSPCGKRRNVPIICHSKA